MNEGEIQSLRMKYKEILKENRQLKDTLAHKEELIKNLYKHNKDYSLVFDKMINGFALHEIILDKDEKPCDFRFLDVNQNFEKLSGLKRSEIIRKTALEVIPNLEPYWIDTYGKVAMTGKPIYFAYYSQKLNKYYEVAVYSPKKRYFAAIYSDITEIKMLEEKEKHLSRIIKAVREINELLLNIDNEIELCQKICDILMEIEPIKSAWVGLIEEGNFEFKPVAYAGQDKDNFFKTKVRWDISAYANAPAGIAIKSGQPVFIRDVQNDLKFTAWCKDTLKRGFRSNLALPIAFKDRVFGVLSVYSNKTDAFGKEEIEFLREVASDIAVGVKSIRLEEDLRKSTKQLSKNYVFETAIKRIIRLIVRADNEHKLYQKICDTLREVQPIKFVWMGRTDEKSLEVKPVTYSGEGIDFFSANRIKLDESELGNAPTGIAVKTGKPFVINDIKAFTEYLPWRSEALKRKLLSYAILPLIYGNKTIGAMAVFSDKKNAFGREEVEFLKEVTNDIVIGVKSTRLEENLKKSNKQLHKSMENTIFAMSRISEAKDPYTAGHQRRVSQLATAIAKKMGLPEEMAEAIRFASIIHDIGKVSIPGEILTKPTKLTKTEFALIKEHTQILYDIIKDIEFPWKIADIILQHHERLDGSGFPNRLKGKEILLEARIIAVADVVEAMNSHRPYRPALGIDEALEEIRKNKGKLYDPDAVDACVKLFKEDGFKFK